MTNFNFIETAIYEEMCETMANSDNGKGTLYIEAERDGISYYVDVDYEYFIEGGYDTDYCNGTGAFETSDIELSMSAWAVEAYDAEGERVYDVDFPTVNEYAIEDAVRRAVA